MCDRVQGGSVTLHPVALFEAMSADSLLGTLELTGIKWIFG